MSPDTEQTIVTTDDQTGADTTGQGQTEQGTVPPTQPTTITPPQTGGENPPAEAGERNVILGKEGKPLPEGPLNIGMKTVMIPDEAGQRAGFQTDNASALVAQFNDFKLFKPKGE